MKNRSAAKREEVKSRSGFLRQSPPGWQATENGSGSTPDGTRLKAQAPNRMNGQGCFLDKMNAERTGLVESHYHAGLIRDGERPVSLTTGSRAGGCGLDGSSTLTSEVAG